MSDPEYAFDNTTYYDDAGLKALIDKALRAADALLSAYSKKHNKGWAYAAVPLEVQVRYYNPSKGESDTSEGVHQTERVRVVETKIEASPGVLPSRKKAPARRQVRIGIVRKTALFRNDLEKLVNLTRRETTLPEEVLREIAGGVISTDSRRRWHLAEALRDWAGGGFRSGFAFNELERFVKKKVSPGCEIIVRQRAPKGSGLQAKITAAESRVGILSRKHSYAVKERTDLQESLAKVLEKERSLFAKLAVEQERLNQLLEQQQPPDNPDEEDECP